ncbi:transcriptional regulator of acetoin/glycerol metabolism [Oxalobacteraceae bacterium GrIS 1.11]
MTVDAGDGCTCCVVRKNGTGRMWVDGIVDVQRIVRREVGARRARALRQRGRRCCYAGDTATGKARYVHFIHSGSTRASRRAMAVFQQAFSRN